MIGVQSGAAPRTGRNHFRPRETIESCAVECSGKSEARCPCGIGSLQAKSAAMTLRSSA